MNAKKGGCLGEGGEGVRWLISDRVSEGREADLPCQVMQLPEVERILLRGVSLSTDVIDNTNGYLGVTSTLRGIKQKISGLR